MTRSPGRALGKTSTPLMNHRIQPRIGFGGIETLTHEHAEYTNLGATSFVVYDVFEAFKQDMKRVVFITSPYILEDPVELTKLLDKNSIITCVEHVLGKTDRFLARIQPYNPVVCSQGNNLFGDLYVRTEWLYRRKE